MILRNKLMLKMHIFKTNSRKKQRVDKMLILMISKELMTITMVWTWLEENQWKMSSMNPKSWEMTS